MENKIKAYKGFNHNMTCRDFKYEVGKEYDHDGEVEACNSGFHACENPLDVFSYYPPCDNKGTPNRFCEVEQGGILDRSDNDKICSSKIHIKAEIGLNGLIHAGVKFILDRVKRESQAKDTENYSAATNTGYQSAATNTGNYSAATNTGNRSAATNTGDQSAATNTGDRSAATNTGNRSAATNTGDQSAATNTGNYSAATNTGYRSAATVEGKDSIAIVTGRNSKAKGALGCWIVLTERNNNYEIVDVKAAKVDGKQIKPDTWYRLQCGKFVEVEQ